MVEKIIEIEKVHFRSSARIISTIGEDLIKDEMAGIVELIKNSHDADASYVTISFCDIEDKNNAKIIIEDDGYGMSKEIIKRAWMSPATNIKNTKKMISPKGRPILGKKGIGRFSAARLGTQLLLETTTINSNEKYSLLINWIDFLEKDNYLEEISLDLKTIYISNNNKSWTRLTISHLTEEWNKKRFNRLLRELRLLISPIKQKNEYEFSIALDLSKSGLDETIIKTYTRKIEPYSLPEITDYYLEAEIKENGTCNISFQRHLFSDKDRKDIKIELKNKNIFNLIEKENSIEKNNEEKKKLLCGPIKLKLFIWDRDKNILESKANRLSDIEEMGLRSIRRYLDDISGIGIFRDGFRVRPYGISDIDDEEIGRTDNRDWLGLGQRRVQKPVMSIGPNQLLGIIEITNENNPYLIDKSSREGLKENEAFILIKQLIIRVLSWIEPIRYDFRKRNQLGRPAAKSTRFLIEKRETSFKHRFSQAVLVR